MTVSEEGELAAAVAIIDKLLDEVIIAVSFDPGTKREARINLVDARDHLLTSIYKLRGEDFRNQVEMIAQKSTINITTIKI